MWFARSFIDAELIAQQLKGSGGADFCFIVCSELAKAKKQRQHAARQEAKASGMHQQRAVGTKSGKGNKGHRKAKKMRQ